MSFQNNSSWLTNSSCSVADMEMCYEMSSRIHQKRPHLWSMDSPEQELSLSKKPAVESFKGTSGSAALKNSLRHTGSHFEYESQTPSLFSPKPAGISNVPNDNNIPPVTASKNMEYNDPGNQFEINPSNCSTKSHEVNFTLSLNSGTRKVKEARISENCFPKSVRSTFTCGDKNEIMTTIFQRSGFSVFSGLAYNTAVGNGILMDPAFSYIDKNFVSVGNSSNMLANQYSNGTDNKVVSVGQASVRRNYNISALGEHYENEAICPTFNLDQEIPFALDPFYCKTKQAFMPAGSNKGKRHVGFYDQQDASASSMGAIYYKEDSKILSMIEHNEKVKETAMPFRGFQNDVEDRDQSGRLISGCSVWLNQSYVHYSGALGQKDSMVQLTANDIMASSSSAGDRVPKNKNRKTKMRSSNNFPSNVKSLLSTGILDGVPVKYVSWSREKSLRAFVKLTGYLCSCQNCKLSKTVSAYAFEQHAGCKSKHPNNHIYFENGKSIYAVIQELKSTPHNILFDVIQNITGSAVNRKNFNAWKAKYEIATGGLEHTFLGKDDLVSPS